MSVYQLIDEIVFPHPDDSEPEGLLAVGGDLRIERLLLAYRLGIFPWYSAGQPILWWSPNPRLILEPSSLHVSRRLRRTLSQGRYKVTFDSAFRQVIEACATTRRKKGTGTWITEEMQAAYVSLHEAGFAHSAESWVDGQLAGGVYGVSLGKCFFGESMFYRERDASKVALVKLVRLLAAWDFDMVDAQVTSSHMIRLGAREIPRREFLRRLERSLSHPSRTGGWIAASDFKVGTRCGVAPRPERVSP